ncbi:MAG: hypothetical protein Q4C87_05875 [Actinomycetaceae bacterium]|nr:hypothetical protein [Actinomycetaceae bacterium]
MSDTFLHIIPTEPLWVPSAAAADRAIAVLAELSPDAERISAERTSQPRFIHQGSNFESLRCPRCGEALDLGWWGDVMDEAYEGGFTDLAVAMPCCGESASLNDVEYDWPAGFACFVLDVANPARSWLTEDELEVLAEALGHPVRQVMSRV